jgi:hypothetical protein
VVAFATIDGLKAEGDFGGGVVQYKWPDPVAGWWSAAQAMGYVKIQNATYNGGLTYPGNNDYPRDFLVLKGGQRTPATSLEMLNLYSVRYLIRDEVYGRNVDCDANTYHGNAQTICRIPTLYESFNQNDADDKNSRLIQGQTAIAHLYPTNVGWYRIMRPLGIGLSHIDGKITITSFGRESTEIDVDIYNYGGNPKGAWLNVTRSSANNIGVPPVVTQARGFYYYDAAKGGDWACVDIYVGNLIVSPYREKEKRITIAMDLNGNEVLDSGQIQLIGAPYPVSATLPAGAVSMTVNTYR